MALTITSDPASDELLSTDQLALLIGMLRDQQGGVTTRSAVGHAIVAASAVC